MRGMDPDCCSSLFQPEGHANEGSSVHEDFSVVGSVTAVIDQQVARSAEPVDAPSVATLVAPSGASSALASIAIAATKSSCSIAGSRPPLTDGFLDAGSGGIYKNVGFTGALVLDVSGAQIWWSCKKQAALACSALSIELLVI